MSHRLISQYEEHQNNIHENVRSSGQIEVGEYRCVLICVRRNLTLQGPYCDIVTGILPEESGRD